MEPIQDTDVEKLPAQGFRLSPQQADLWLLRRAGKAFPYRSRCAMTVEGRLDAGVLREALRRVVARHEILRTTFHRPAGMKEPVQVVEDVSPAQWSESGAGASGGLPVADALALLWERENAVPFDDLSRGPLLHATLDRLAPEKHLVGIMLPALCADAASLENLVAEIVVWYGALRSGREAVSDEPLQYADYAEWQNQLLEGGDDRALRAAEFWRSRRELPGIRQRPPFEERTSESDGFSPRRRELSLDPAVRGRLEALAGEMSTSEGLLLQAAFAAVLWRLGGAAEIVLGEVAEGRGHEDLRSAVGPFARILPQPCRFDPRVSFREVVEQLRASVEERGHWEDYSALGRGAGSGAGELPVCFEALRATARLEAAGLSLSVERLESFLGPFALKLSCRLGPGFLRAALHYDGSRYLPAGADRIARHLERLIEAALARPESPLAALPLLEITERHRLLFDFALGESRRAALSCVHHAFEDRAAQGPKRTAIRFGEEEWSYGRLNARANQLAHALRRAGIGPDVRVGLCLDRSAESILGILGILKSGGAYVPLNPDHPRARLLLQLSEAAVPVVVTQEAWLDRFEGFEGRVLCLDRDRGLFDVESEENPDRVATPQHLVSVIYTSGSTGAPKGVGVSHGALANYARFVCDELVPEAGKGGLDFATVSTLAADLGNTSIFPALVSGGCLHIVPYEIATDGEQLARYLAAHPVDVLKIVPSHLAALMGKEMRADVLPRRYLVLGGEKLSPEMVRRVAESAPACVVVNHYGPTETTVGSLTFRYEPGRGEDAPASVPIGRPIANTEIYLLDALGEPVPAGVPGELYIGGAGLARGYLNRPGETAGRFVPHAFAERPGERLYRTGDLARFLPNGNVEFLGRADEQVKIRGYRVEPGEVASVLGRHPHVRQAVVVAREEEGSGPRLVAYCVPRAGASLTPAALREFLLESVPDYMVPGAFSFLEAMPLTANGKVDRVALPPPVDQVGQDGEPRAYAAPRTPAEEIIAAVWSEVLKVERIGIHDDFFALGGHSLLATQIVARLRRALATDLSLRSLFEAPTIAGLAESIRRAPSAGQGAIPRAEAFEAVPEQTGGR